MWCTPALVEVNDELDCMSLSWSTTDEEDHGAIAREEVKT